MWNKMRALAGLDVRTLLLFIESFMYLGWARFQLVYRPFARISPSLGSYMLETESGLPIPAHHRRSLLHIRSAIHIMSKYTLWESKCLVRAVAAMKMLERRRIESTLYLGTAKDEHGNMIAHAWLRSGSFYVTGAEEMHRFTITGTFGNRSCLRNGK